MEDSIAEPERRQLTWRDSNAFYEPDSTRVARSRTLDSLTRLSPREI
jgi:hypothetical protein